MANDRRLELQTLLEEVLGTSEVHFQPPPTISLRYPCIVYELSGMEPTFADDKLYGNRRKYTVIVIDRDPDSVLPDRVSLLPLCKLDRPYSANNLYHFAFTIYY